MNKKIVIKEIDKLTSSVSKDKTISEYLIYYMVGDAKVDAFIEIGEEAKKTRVNELYLTHFMSDDNMFLNIDGSVEEIAFEEIITTN